MSTIPCRDKLRRTQWDRNWLRMASQSDKKGDDEKGEGSSSSGNEVTAEWVVKAQLKISQPKKKAASFGTGDCGANRSTGSPCRVVYKWNSDAKDQDRASTTRQNVTNSSEKVSEGEREKEWWGCSSLPSSFWSVLRTEKHTHTFSFVGTFSCGK